MIQFLQGLDFIVDGGVRVADPSTVVDMTGSYPKITRLGKVITHVNGFFLPYFRASHGISHHDIGKLLLIT